MKAVIQRVRRAVVTVDEEIISQINHGLLVLLGVAKGDDEPDARYIVEKIATLRIFAGAAGKMNLSIQDVGGAVVVVSQFTLLGDTAQGRRPGFDQAAPPDRARVLYDAVIAGLKALGIKTDSGRFGAYMTVSLENDGPVTFILDSRSSVGQDKKLGVG
jgi:D-aminoacyl-tRNA deacylase